MLLGVPPPTGSAWHRRCRQKVRGDSDTDLDIVLKDRYGDVACESNGDSDRERCHFVPDYTGTYRVEIHNRHNYYSNVYRIWAR